MRRAALWAVAVLHSCAAALAESVPVRYPEGVVHGFLALRTLEGQTLADGDLIQTARGGRVTSRLVFRFKDGSLHEETAVFTQDRDFRLLSDRLVQRGPSFPRSIDVAVDYASGRIDVRYKEKDGKERALSDRLELPPDLSNGLIFTLLKNISPQSGKTVVPMVAATPKPRLVQLVITPSGDDAFTVGDSARKAVHYVLRIEIGGIAGLVAPLLGKQPPDSHVWILQGDAPAFVKSEGPLAMGGPIWRIELVSPVWPRGPAVKR